MRQRIEISRNGVWAGVGVWTGEEIVDSPAVLGDTQEESDEVYEAIADAIESGEEMVEVGVDGETCYTWTLGMVHEA